MLKEEGLQNPIESLISYFNNIIPLNDKERQLVSELFRPRHYRKRQYILQEGDVCNEFNFVVAGCLKMYKVDDKGVSHILQFASENWWLVNIESFHRRTASVLNIEAVENTTILQINYENILVLYRAAPKFDRIFRILIENAYVSLQKRLLLNLSSTAEERYEAFLASYSHLSNRLSQTLVSSFIGITPEFLSRIRSQQGKSKS